MKYSNNTILVALLWSLSFSAYAIPMEPVLYVNTSNRPSLVQTISLDGSEVNNVVVVCPSTSICQGGRDIAVDPLIGRMFIATADEVFSANLDGSGLTKISDAPTVNLEIDVLNQRIFLSHSKIIGYDGTELGDFVERGATAYDPGAEKLYVARNNDYIRRVDLDGNNVENLVLLQNLTDVPDIEIDIASGKMYWLTIGSLPGQDMIFWADLDGTNVEPLITGLLVPRGLFVDIDNSYLYWTASGVFRSDLDGSNITLITNDNANLDPHGPALGPPASEFDFPPDPTPSVPEPATVLLMGIGLVGLGFARRRRLNA